jgi:uncharacterized phage protein gp47/JayE
MPFVLTDAGLLTETQAEARAALLARIRLAFGDDMDDATESINGQLVDILSEYMATYQQVTLDGHRAWDPAAARGVQLDQRSALTGSRRRAAYGSSVVLTLTFTSAGSVVDGNLVKLSSTGTEWAAVDGPYTAAGPFPQDVQATFRSVDTGPVPALAGSAWEQVDFIAGLDDIQNAEDAVLGAVVESDPDFRVRRQRELFATGQGPLSTITALVSRVVGVVFARTYHNPATQPADADGIPFKAFNVVARTDPNPPSAELRQEIFDAIFKALGAGGQAYGTDEVGTSVDTEGKAHPVAFDLVADVQIELAINLVTSTSEIAITPNIEAIVKAHVLDVAKSRHEVIGRDVRMWDYTSAVGELVTSGQITGVDQVISSGRRVGDALFTTGKRSIGIRQLPVFDSSRIVVVQT